MWVIKKEFMIKSRVPSKWILKYEITGEFYRVKKEIWRSEIRERLLNINKCGNKRASHVRLPMLWRTGWGGESRVAKWNQCSDTAARIVTLIEEGRSRWSLAKEFNLTLSSVQNIFNRYAATGSYQHWPRSGRPPVTSLREDLFVTQKVQKNQYVTSSVVAAYLNSNRETQVSSRTIRRRFNQIGLNSRRPAKGPPLTHKHQKDCLNFAKTHVSWTTQAHNSNF